MIVQRRYLLRRFEPPCPRPCGRCWQHETIFAVQRCLRRQLSDTRKPAPVAENEHSEPWRVVRERGWEVVYDNEREEEPQTRTGQGFGAYDKA